MNFYQPIKMFLFFALIVIMCYALSLWALLTKLGELGSVWKLTQPEFRLYTVIKIETYSIFVFVQ